MTQPSYASEITRLIKEILADSKKMSREKLDIKYAEFKDAFRQLYEVILDKNDHSSMKDLMIPYMLGMLEKKDKGEVDEFDTNVKVSNLIADKFLYKGNGIARPSEKEKKAKYDSMRAEYERKKLEETSSSKGPKIGTKVSDQVQKRPGVLLDLEIIE
jgi:hypothetical protein